MSNHECTHHWTVTSPCPFCQKVEIERLTAELAAAQAERDELRNEIKRRSKESSIDRLHNLCRALEEHRNESPYNAEALDLADASYKEKCEELTAARETITRMDQAGDELLAVYNAAQADRQALRGALREYGEHTSQCRVTVAGHNKADRGKWCDCGLTAALGEQ